MQVTHSLTDEDVARAHKLPTEPKQMAEAQQKTLSAIDHYIGAFIMPSMQGSLSQNDLEFCLFVLYYRILAFMKTALVLSNPLNFQSLTGASRSVIEVYVDMELLFQGKVENGVHLFKTHGDALTLKAARRMTEFYTAHPDLPCDPVSFQVHTNYIENNAAKIDAATTETREASRAVVREVGPRSVRPAEFPYPFRLCRCRLAESSKHDGDVCSSLHCHPRVLDWFIQDHRTTSEVIPSSPELL